MFLPFLSLVPIFIAIFLFSLWRPKIAIFLPVIFHVSFLVKTKIFFVPSTGLELLIIGVLVGVWVGVSELRSPLSGGKPRIPLPYIVPGLLILLFVLSSTISAIIAPHSATAWGAWKALIIEPIFYAVTLIWVVKRYNLENRLIVSLLGGGVVSCLFSLVFWRFGADFWRFRGIYDVPNSLALILAPLLVVAVLAFSTRFYNESFLQKQESVGRDQCRRGAPLCAPAQASFAGGPACNALRSNAGGHGDPPLRRDDTMLHGFRHKRWFLCITICIFSILLIATQSIAGIVSVGVVLMFIFFINKRLSRLVMVGLFLMALLAISTQMFSGKIPHLLNRTSSSFVAREQIWTVAVALIKDHALLGTGLGTFEPAYQEKLKTLNTNFGTSGVLEWVVRDPHNIFLSFWLNTGFLGLLTMAGLVFLVIKKTILRNAVVGAGLRARPHGLRSKLSLASGGLRDFCASWRILSEFFDTCVPLWRDVHFYCFARRNKSREVLPYDTDPCFNRDDTTTNQYRMFAGAAMLTLVIFGLFDVPYWKNDLAVLWWVYLASAIL